MIVGTAGHIDHGKSALVTALTGQKVDRLAEERRRGITIDLNFAPLDLGDGVIAGVVDVPGHEDFVRTMVAGASGVDVALLVVAADEGIMPQTEEHLAVLEQLGVRAGVPVLTKADLVDPEWLELVAADLAARLARSSVPFDSPIAVSAVTGAGLERLRAGLRAHAALVPSRARLDAFRLPIDRAFSLAGVGTVVTGTAWSGTLRIGDPVRVLPGGLEGRVRSIESHGRPAESSDPGARVAVGIAGVERARVGRGQVLVEPGVPWIATSALDVDLGLLSTAPRVLAARTRVRLHLGTVEVMARVLPRGGPILPGGRGPARLHVETPLVARGGDHFVLRSFSPVTTIGGGRVLDPLPPGRRTPWPDDLAAPEPAARLRAVVERRRFGVELASMPVLTGLPAAEVLRVAGQDHRLGLVGGRLIAASALSEAADRAIQAIAEFHRRRPMERGMPLETLRRAMQAPDWLADAAIEAAGDRRLAVEGGVARLLGFEPKVEGGEPEIERLVQILLAAGLTPPSVAELEQATGRRDVSAMLRLAAGRGLVEAVERDRYYSSEALRRFAGVLEEIGRAGEIHPPAVRDRVGISRKFLIPLLEWADSHGITVRHGAVRRLVRAGH